ncbi:Hypp3789 [Branchiostoma lanceolatum]|uniref:Hypp3789 protein n=1 Tax=Branchiostoma lanceolatum TaxID=7740 RepID=A0A8K0A213_BRALA|nr:Hypp3789 [Branchiostoma lanceolatum]
METLRGRRVTLPHASRTFYSLPTALPTAHTKMKSEDREKLMKYVDESLIGRDRVFAGPFGSRQVTYCDYTASGRALTFIEDYIRDQVLPVYGNTHTTTSVTSLQTTLYRHEARDIIRNAVNAGEHDAVIFVGSGCTGAIHKLIHSLHMEEPPIVFVGPFEHHSNLLPWREIGSRVMRIAETNEGLLDLEDLEAKLKAWQSCGSQLIGAFSAASNVTGILTDTVQTSVLLHKYGAIAVWDYASAGPYVDIDMNPVVSSADQGLGHKDAVIISPHKFVGGPGTPGVLIAKKSLFQNPVPSGCGGGSVFFVSRETHRYLQNVETREEGGTPAIVESIRAGLVFQLKQAIGSDLIMRREQELCKKAFDFWLGNPNLVVLGSTEVKRLPIMSFMVRHPQSGLFLHHNYVSVLLNDLFGIQARGGCACAGPYAQDLMGIDEELANKIEKLLVEDKRLDRDHLRRYNEFSEREILRPGFARLNLPYFATDECVDFILEAVAMIAEHGWKLLPQYLFKPDTGEWKNRNHQVFKDRKWLGSISYSTGHMTFPEPDTEKTKGKLPKNYKECLEIARKVFDKASSPRLQLPDQALAFDEEAEKLRWFLLPSEALDHLVCPDKDRPYRNPPFSPLKRVYSMPEVIDNGDTTPALIEESHDRLSTIPMIKTQDDEMDEISEEEDNLNLFNMLRNWRGNSGNRRGSGSRNLMRPIPDGHLNNHMTSGHVGLGGHTIHTPTLSYANHRRNSDGLVGRGGLIIGGGPHGGSSNVMGTSPGRRRASAFVVGTRDVLLPETGQKLPMFGRRNSIDMLDLHKWGKKLQDTLEGSGSGENVDWEIWGSLPSSRNSSIDQGNDSMADNVNEQDNSADSTSDDRSEDCSLKGDTEEDTPNHEGTLHIDLPTDAENNVTSTEPRMTVTSGETKKIVERKTSLNNGGASPKIRKQDTILSVDEMERDAGTADSRKSDATDRCSSERSKTKNKMKHDPNNPRWHAPPKRIMKLTIEAMTEYSMIQDGDRVLLCLSGGKDSLSLLHTLRQYQFFAKSKNIHFDLGAVTVDPQTASYDPSPLKDYLSKLGVPYFYEEQGIMAQAASMAVCTSICSYCSRMKRGRIYACARREGYNVLAMGQHLDDLAESFMMSAFHNGLLRTMKANYTVREEDLRVIRPFVYVREKDLRNFAEKVKLPIIAENCPACFEAPKERHRTKQLLASQELLFPKLFQSLLRSMKPLMARNKTGLEAQRAGLGQEGGVGQGQMEEEDDGGVNI